MMLTSSLAEAANHIALVIGNSKYENLGTLSNTTKDAKDVDKTLREMGYKSKLVLDADYGTLRKEIKAFSAESEKSSIAIIFYAGHGAQVNQENYLLPTDIEIPKRETDIQLSAIKVDDLVNYLKSKTKVVFLDACRDNPALIKTLSKGRGSYRGGLAPINSSSVDDRSSGVFVAYATDSGNVALDGDGVNSPFTKALIKYIKRPVSIDDMFSMVTKDVLRETKNVQKPYKYASMDSIVCLPGGCQSADDGSHSIRSDSQVDKDTSRASGDDPLALQWTLFDYAALGKAFYYVNPKSIATNKDRVWADIKEVRANGEVTLYSAVADCIIKKGSNYAIKEFDSSGKKIKDLMMGNPLTIDLYYDTGMKNSVTNSASILLCNPEKWMPMTLVSEDYIRFYTLDNGVEMSYLKTSINSEPIPSVIVKFDFGKNIPLTKLSKEVHLYANFESLPITSSARYMVQRIMLQCSAKTAFILVGNLYDEGGSLVAYVDYFPIAEENRIKITPQGNFDQLSRMVCI
jgi:hypothetical protein